MIKCDDPFDVLLKELDMQTEAIMQEIKELNSILKERRKVFDNCGVIERFKSDD